MNAETENMHKNQKWKNVLERKLIQFSRMSKFIPDRQRLSWMKKSRKMVWRKAIKNISDSRNEN